MALSTPAATLYISSKNIYVPTTKNASIFSNSTIRFSIKQRIRRQSIRSSSDVSSGTPAAETESEKSIDEAPKGPPSIISALNVERALRGIAITDADHYARLGIQRGCSYEQVTVAYRNKVDELLNQGLDEEELSKKMDLLKESYSILSSVEERRLYDWSLRGVKTQIDMLGLLRWISPKLLRRSLHQGNRRTSGRRDWLDISCWDG